VVLEAVLQRYRLALPHQPGDGIDPFPWIPERLGSRSSRYRDVGRRACATGNPIAAKTMLRRRRRRARL